MSTPTALVILDGFGISNQTKHNAIAAAHTPCLDYLFANYPHTTLKASGTAVGLPEGSIGNSEVGHQTIGSGRITQEPLVLINASIDNGTFCHHATIASCFKELAHSGNALHLIGLISDAGVHSSFKHLYALIEAAQAYHIKHVYIHAILDGRDVPPQSALHYLNEIAAHCTKHSVGIIASVVGRWYAMDRNGNWERTKQAYDMLTHDAAQAPSYKDVITQAYAHGTTDEYIEPTVLAANTRIKTGDGIVFFNIRADRMRQLTQCFANPAFTHFATQQITPRWCLTMTPYFNKPYHEQVIFKQAPLAGTLKDVLQEHSKSMFSIAETEKYAHVTYFFDGRREAQYPLETRVLIPSLKVKSYEEHPCMSAPEITNAVLHSLATDAKDFYLINYANADMVGHSGNFEATAKAIECIDDQIKKLYTAIVKERNGTLYITGDHGKAEDMFDEHSRQPRTAHTVHPVPFIMIQKILKGQSHELPLHDLADIAPYIIKYMDLPIPNEMAQKS